MQVENSKYYACPLCGKPSKEFEVIKQCYEGHARIDENVSIKVIYSQGRKYPICLKLVFPDETTVLYDFRREV